MSALNIRKATKADENAIWEIIHEVIVQGDTYVFDPNSTKEEMLEYWCDPQKYTYVATSNGEVLGTFVIKDNQPALGKHVANASYMTSKMARGKGVGSAMAEFSLVEAKRIGYNSMQFNIVVSTNHGAVKLWEKFGFKIMAEIPESFNHKALGLVSSYIMWKKL